MNKEHSIVGGANRIDACAKHISEVMENEGYRGNTTKIADGSVTQVHVAKVGLTGKVVAYAALNLWSVGDDLKFKIERNLAVNDPTIGIPTPWDLMVGFPLGMTKTLLDAHKQAKLEERLYLAASMFLTAS